MKIEATQATLGAIVTDVNLNELDEASFAGIEDAWHQYAVLVFPNQHLSDDQHLAFTRRFGRLEKGLKRASRPGLGKITNVTKEGTVASPDSLQNRFNSGNTGWHSDSSYKRVGAKASILAAHQVPTAGGETEWADMRAAYDELDAATQHTLDDKIAVHSYVFSHAPHGGLEFLSDDELDDLPPVEHAIVRVHPATGRRSLFLGRHASHMLGEDEQQSRQLIRRLTEHACQPPRTWKHTWSAGDLALWDNRCVLHRGHPWPLDQPRLMARSTVAGDAPDNEWAADESSD